jgi:hypothetical protein
VTGAGEGISVAAVQEVRGAMVRVRKAAVRAVPVVDLAAGVPVFDLKADRAVAEVEAGIVEVDRAAKGADLADLRRIVRRSNCPNWKLHFFRRKRVLNHSLARSS